MAQPEEERSWVEKARAGDPSERSDAAGWLYERYFDRIYRYVYLKLGDPTDAEDLTEQVFLKMIEAVGNFQWQGSSFASWLYRIAHNQVVDFLRQHSRRPQTPLESVGDTLPADGHDPHEHAERRDFADQLIEAMEDLTDLQAQVIALKFGSDLTNAHVAEILDRTEGAVKALQYSALQKLNKVMASRGFGPGE
ncbi:MAG TPA: sigma-70 family RNA polymerase sigma factor [Chloroflexia bacterium]|nr:sigma-70 family RNA polymerase sigma factor [Chloroflexia bacterium]